MRLTVVFLMLMWILWLCYVNNNDCALCLVVFALCGLLQLE